ncbi:CLUMA_CG003688, isoform A [Clunio marinus]|uniref:CLUMA_CG003688, isoform A n=1 Tax=Clunio marinus TaxID=568069 RepID=A0A1J1HPI1_9DIPT|nr:CLUMA_CG003688, isoform A [Clunio marinus]
MNLIEKIDKSNLEAQASKLKTTSVQLHPGNSSKENKSKLNHHTEIYEHNTALNYFFPLGC